MIKIAIHKQFETTKGNISLAVNMEVNRGDLVAIYGVSGVGKTTLLRMLAGLTSADRGYIEVNGTSWFDTTKKINLSAQKRNVGFVFQDYALFPNMTILENLQFANPNLRFINQLVRQTNLDQLKNKKPKQLSGGQQQRVALARALVMQPSILLLDEPLSALDYKLRQQMQELIAALHQEHEMTTLMVSHDIPEIIRLATKILVLEGENAVLYNDPIQYFKDKNVLHKIDINGVVQRIKGNELEVKVGTQLMNIIVKPDGLQSINIGDEIRVKSYAFQPQVIKINRL